MNNHANDSTKLLLKNNNLSRTLQQRGEGINPQTSYLLQLNNLLYTARRLNNARVIFALSSLITRRGGVV